jgi:hypothetical protein
MQAALCKGHVSLEQLSGLNSTDFVDLGKLLGGKVLALLPEPIHVIGFSDEEGVRCARSVGKVPACLIALLASSHAWQLLCDVR